MRSIWMPVAACALSVVPAAAAAAPQPEGPVFTAPDWRRRPSIEEMFVVWPKEAMQRGRGGRGTISCKISVQGMLFDCRVVSEEPAGAGFGAAAIALTPQFLMKPPMLDGKPVSGGTIEIPIRFVWPAGVSGTGRSKGASAASNVPWLQAPTYAEVVAAFPAKAKDRKVGGQATLSCKFKADGRLDDCHVLGESPFGMGFGAAAKTLVPRFLGPTAFGDGTPIKGAFTQLPVTFPVEMLNGGEPVLGKPQWAAVPTAETLRGAIPNSAVAAGLRTARVVLSCKVKPDGQLEVCRVDSEEPKGYGFGDSTLRIATSVKLSIWTSEGLPSIGSTVTVPIRYEIPPGVAAPAKP